MSSFSDFGTHSEASTDYPDFAHEVADSIEKNEFDLGILICGTGIGMDITANKHKGIRAALCWRPEIADSQKATTMPILFVLPARFY